MEVKQKKAVSVISSAKAYIASAQTKKQRGSISQEIRVLDECDETATSSLC